MKIFISHDFSHDRDRFDNLRARLDELDDIEVVAADVNAGEYLGRDLLKSIHQTDICIFICTPDSLKSNWCATELGAYWGLNKKILTWNISGNKNDDIAERVPQSSGIVIVSHIDEIIDSVKNQRDTDIPSTEGHIGPATLAVPVKSFITDQIRDSVTPESWKSRDLYIGLQGARNWLTVSSDPAYKPFVAARANLFEENNPIRSLIDAAKCHSLVSFGPGDSSLDKEIVLRYCAQDDQLFKYFPVDINPYLLSKACHEIQSDTNAIVPFGILADFEESLQEIFELVYERRNAPYLFSCLGYTLGNLDTDERIWIQKIAQKMKTGDFLLLDYLRVSSDFNIDEYKTNAYKDYTQALRNQVAHPIAVSTGLGRNRLVDNFEAAFDFSIVKGNDDIVRTRITYSGYGLSGVEKEGFKDKLVVNMHRYRAKQFIDQICDQTSLTLVDHTQSKELGGFYQSGLSLFKKT